MLYSLLKHRLKNMQPLLAKETHKGLEVELQSFTDESENTSEGCNYESNQTTKKVEKQNLKQNKKLYVCDGKIIEKSKQMFTKTIKFKKK